MSDENANQMPSPKPPFQWLAFAARLSFWYPVLFLGCLYAEFLLAWFALQHRPWLGDDAKTIGGSNWLHPINAILGLGMVPIGLAGLVFNPIYMIKERAKKIRLVLRIGIYISIWVAGAMIFLWDPLGVADWWIGGFH